MAVNIEFTGLKSEKKRTERCYRRTVRPNTNINERNIDMMQPDFTK